MLYIVLTNLTFSHRSLTAPSPLPHRSLTVPTPFPHIPRCFRPNHTPGGWLPPKSPKKMTFCI